MQGLRDLIASERGVFCIAAFTVSCVLVFVDRITGLQWLGFMATLSGMLVASKTVTTALEQRRSSTE